MFFSLNKKLIYTITVFFLFTSLIFIYAFYILNANKIREEQKSAIARNQQYIELLYQNISLRKELSDIKKSILSSPLNLKSAIWFSLRI